MKRVTTQRASSYMLGQSQHPNTALADVLMHAETLLREGYGITITPPATARPTPLSVEVVDLEVIHG